VKLPTLCGTVKGASDIYPEQVTGGLYLDIKPNREAAARYGIDVGEVQSVIETAIGEKQHHDHH